MTTVTFYKNKESCIGFVCMGHAGYSKKHILKKNEPDVLCAAISVLVIGTVNALEELAHEALRVVTNEESGFIKCDFESVLSEKSLFLVDSLIFNLENLSKEYGEKYLQVKFEEV